MCSDVNTKLGGKNRGVGEAILEADEVVVEGESGPPPRDVIICDAVDVVVVVVDVDVDDDGQYKSKLK